MRRRPGRLLKALLAAALAVSLAGIVSTAFSQATIWPFSLNDGTTNFGVYLGALSGGYQGASLGTITSNQLRLYTNNTDRLTVDTNGNVGIGTASPVQQLDVVGTVNATSQICLAGTCQSSWPSGGGGGWTTSGSYVYNNTASVNVGIGTAVPGGLLDVNGKVVIGSTAVTGSLINAPNGIAGLNANGVFNAVASNNAKLSHDAISQSSATSWARLKQYSFNENFTGTVRIYYEFRSGGASATAYANIYKNGVAIGTSQNTTSLSYIIYSADFPLTMKVGDTLELWGYITNPTSAVLVQNFRVEWDWVPAKPPSVTLS